MLSSLTLSAQFESSHAAEQSFGVSLSPTQAPEQKLLTRCTVLSARLEQSAYRLAAAQRQSAISWIRLLQSLLRVRVQALRLKVCMHNRSVIATALPESPVHCF